ncbi:MAG: hypothetical protein ACYTF7_08140 [Planctomycetota bacterium]|jgi:hypothetical protein
MRAKSFGFSRTLAATLLCSTQAAAQTAQWNNPAGGNIFHLSNWTFFDLPPTGPLPTHMRFSLDASYIVDIPAVTGGARTSTMLVNKGDLTLHPKGDISLHLEGTSDLSQPGVVITADGTTTRVLTQAALVAPTGMHIGGIPSASLMATNILSTGNLLLAGAPDTTGSLHVSGEHAHLRVGTPADTELSWLNMAPSGDATLHITNGAHAEIEALSLTSDDSAASASIIAKGLGTTLNLHRGSDHGSGTSSIVVRDHALLRTAAGEDTLQLYFTQGGTHSLTIANGATLEGIRRLQGVGDGSTAGNTLIISNTTLDLDRLDFDGTVLLENNAEVVIRDYLWNRTESQYQFRDSTITLSPVDGAGLFAIRFLMVLGGDSIEISNTKILNHAPEGTDAAASIGIGAGHAQNRLLIDDASEIEIVGAGYIWTMCSTTIAGPGTSIEQSIGLVPIGPIGPPIQPLGSLQLGGGSAFPSEPRPIVTIKDSTTIDATFLQFHGVDASFYGTPSSVTASNQMHIDNARVTLSPSVRLQAPELIIGPRSGDHRHSILAGHGRIDAKVHNNGVVSPSGDRPVIHVTGNFDQREQAHFDFDDTAGHLVTDGRLQRGALEIDIQRINGKIVVDQLVVDGHATFDGTLTIRLDDNVIPRPGDIFTFVKANSWSGGFRNLELPETPPSVVPSFRTTKHEISLVYRSRGDINRDSHVDGADLGHMLSRWGTTDPDSDINLDGLVDSQDLGLLLADWGS